MRFNFFFPFAIFFTGVITFSFGAKYYIDPGKGDDRFTGATEAAAWKTVGKANQSLNAGDTVLIKAGRYRATISPKNSGAPGKPIVYMNFGTDTVVFSDTVYGMYLDAKSYILVQGIVMKNLDRFVYIRNKSNHNMLAWCVFDSARLKDGQPATWAGSVISGSSQYNRIHHCQFSNYGSYTDDDNGCVIDIGAEENKTDSTCFNLIENSSFFHGGHHVMGVYGKYNVIRNNSFHNEPWSMGSAASDRGAVLYGDRNLSFSGYAENGGRNLVEGNRVGYSADPSDNNGASGAALNSSDNIVRFNCFFNNISAGVSMSVTESYLQDVCRNKVYHNSFFNNGHNPYDSIDHMSSGLGFGIYSGPLVIRDNAIKNNIFYKHKLTIGEYNINTADRTGLIAAQSFACNWDGDKRGDPRFTSASTGLFDPWSASLPDLHLTGGSPCIDSATFLTTVVSASGSGTSFKVADAGYFTDGWGIEGVSGDEIELLGSTQRARVTNIDYATNTLTVDKTIAWTKDQGVCLPYVGAGPDIGAFEYGAENSVQPAGRVSARLSNAARQHTLYDVLGRQVGIPECSGFDAKAAANRFGTGIYIETRGNGKTREVKRIAVMGGRLPR
jgi:hypothetical protein